MYQNLNLLNNRSNTMVMIDPAIIERLLAVDTSFIGMPHYSKKTKKTKKGQAKDIYWFKNILRYVPFCKDLDEMNQKAGMRPCRGYLVQDSHQCLQEGGCGKSAERRK
jgi:hypothetical protein